MPSFPDAARLPRPGRHDAGDTAIVPRLDVTGSTPEACLVHIRPTGPNLGRRYAVGAESLVVGRDAGSQIPVPDSSVSRRHAVIELADDGLYHVRDLNSTNGTYVNNVRVGEKVLTDGDYIHVGPCIFRFLAGGNVEADYHEEIHRLAILDPLTGLHNRRALNEFLERELERARRYARPLAVVLFDVDHFKAVNDRLGHLAGDFTLKNLADRVKGLTRKDELLARYGGEELALVLPEADLQAAVRCADRIRRAVAEKPFEFEGHPYPVTISAGAGVTRPGVESTIPDLLQQADTRLYEAKRAGRNRVAPAPETSH